MASQEILQRVLNLETSNVTNNSIIATLQRDKKEVEQKLQQIQSKVQGMENKLDKTVQFNEKIKEDLQKVVHENQQLKQDLEKAENDRQRMKQDMEKAEIYRQQSKQDMKKAKNERQQMEKDMGKAENVRQQMKQNIRRLEKKVETLFTSSETTHSKVSQMSALHKVLSRSLVERQNIPDLYKKVDVLDKRCTFTENETDSMRKTMISVDKETSFIVKIRDDKRESTTHAMLSPTGGLVTGRLVKMDTCVELIKAGWFDKASGSVITRRDGLWFFGVRAMQNGDGSITIRLVWDFGANGQAMVKTRCHLDVRNGLAVIYFKKDCKFWLEAKRRDGKAEIYWCHVYCWWMGP